MKYFNTPIQNHFIHKLLLVYLMLCATLFINEVSAQGFIRSELPTELVGPWEMTYGPDDHLWITEAEGKVSRVHPETGAKQEVYSAPDFFDGSPLEQSPNCGMPPIQAGTLGLALDPDFSDPDHSYIYYVYSYNSGTEALPATKFKIVRLWWDALSNEASNATDLVLDIPTGYDHVGGRLMAIKRGETPYLFLTVGDNGISDENNPDCYVPQSSNPNNFAQDPTYKNGKIHRFHLDGSIPADNPIPGNSFFTRGHRNPQGLMYNAAEDILYNVEHGDRTDDEINILEAGMNYGWKQARGYHDGNREGELDFVANYTADASIENDALKEPLYAWCLNAGDDEDSWLQWCTVAPSDGIYYGGDAISKWENSLLVVTLKDGDVTDKEVYQFRLTDDGKNLAPSSSENPNPKRFFGEDQDINGRLRDIAISADGKKVFLVNNGGGDLSNKIKVYTYDDLDVIVCFGEPHISLYPNPTQDMLYVYNDLTKITSYVMYDITGKIILSDTNEPTEINMGSMAKGVYYLKIEGEDGFSMMKRIVKN